VKEIILASTSRYRRELLGRLGVTFRAVAPKCDEAGLDHLPVEERALALAERKARSVADDFEGMLVLASDKIAEVEGTSLVKPGTAARARETLQLLAGKEHRLVTGVALLDTTPGGRLETTLEIACLRMRPLTDEEIAAYVEREPAVDCVGAYRVEGLGAALFESIDSKDPTGIVGLPLTGVVDLLARFGLSVFR